MEFVQHLLKQPVLNSTLRVLAQDAAVEAEKNVQNTKLTLSFTDSKFPVFAGLAIGFLFAAFLHYLVVATVICGIFFLIKALHFQKILFVLGIFPLFSKKMRTAPSFFAKNHV